MRVKRKMKAPIGRMALPIRTLRHELGRTQRQMANQLEMSLRAYSYWESGEQTPRSNKLEKLLALCPNDEIRRNFGLQFANVEATDARAQAPQPKTPEERQALRARNIALQGVELLYKDALKSGPAREKLRKIAEELNEAAGGHGRKAEIL